MMINRKRNKQGRFFRMKKCHKCHLIKLDSNFHKDKSRKDRLNPTCKECREKYYEMNKEEISIKKRKRYQEIKEKINTKQRDRYNTDKQHRQQELSRTKQWRENNSDKVKKNSRKYRKMNKEKIRVNSREYYNRHPERESARQSVRYAVKTGKIQKPNICTNCNAIKPLVGHHEDYDKPLNVIWLCKSCHKQLHNTIIKV